MLVIPPRPIPRQGRNRSDAEYVEAAKQIVQIAADHCGLTPSSRVLDIGCGAGRFLTGLLATYGRIERYVGIDVRAKCIEWNSKAFSEATGRIQFEWLDVRNARYRKVAAAEAAGVRLPAEDRGFDVIVLWSVFSHMPATDVRHYLSEIERTMSDGGRCLCTAFVEDGVSDWEENPENPHRRWSGALHCARFSTAHFHKLIADAGLDVVTRLPPPLPARQWRYVLARARASL